MRLTLLCITVLSIGPGLKAQTGRPKANDDAFIQAKARAIAEYRLPLPGSGIKMTDIEDGVWFERLSESEKAERFKAESCFALYDWINCRNLRRHLTELYSDNANLRIPYPEALYIAVQQEKGATSSVIKVEIAAARDTMREYYALIDKPSLYLTYDSLKAVRDDITFNALKKDRIIKPLTAKDSPVIRIKSAKVHSVMKNAKWPGVIVMTYDEIEGKALFGVVYVRPDDLKNPKTHDSVEGLKRDDVVQIVGSVYSFESKPQGAVPSEAMRISGEVFPVPEK
jgi:hypothetical protein